MRRRFLLKGPDLDQLKARAVREYGGARIVSAEKVIPKGLAGVFAKPSFHLVIEVTSPDPSPITAPLPLVTLGGAVGLLADPAPGEDGKPGVPEVSTSSGKFGQLLDDLNAGIGAGPTMDGKDGN